SFVVWEVQVALNLETRTAVCSDRCVEHAVALPVPEHCKRASDLVVPRADADDRHGKAARIRDRAIWPVSLIAAFEHRLIAERGDYLRVEGRVCARGEVCASRGVAERIPGHMTAFLGLEYELEPVRITPII